jgi:phage terminase Nu1 subunit (DNA packaging protein)
MPRKSASNPVGNSAELATLLNLSLPQCYNLANSGTIPKPDSGTWDLTRCAHGYIKYLQGRAGTEKRDYAVERTRLTKAQADKVEMEIHVLAGQLLPAEIVESVWSGMTAAARQRLLGLPYRLATAALAAESFAAIETAAVELITEALNELHRFDPADYQPRLAKHGSGLAVETAAPADDQPVGRPGKTPQPRGQRRTRPVAN